MGELGYGRGDYDSGSWLRDGGYAIDGGGDGIEPALELFGEGGTIVCVPGASVAGFTGGHCDGECGLEALSWWHDRYIRVDETADVDVDYKSLQIIDKNSVWLDGSAQVTRTTRTQQWMSTRPQAQ